MEVLKDLGMNPCHGERLGIDMADSCAHREHRQFDFWIGEWEVRDPEGGLAGQNRIVPLFGGCALREEWRGESGHSGTSLNAWSRRRGTWHQTWVDSSGLVLLLDGGLRGEAMILEGRAPHPEEPGREATHRISWSVIDGDPDRVRQHWEVSSGNGWETVFDGRYHRVAPGVAPEDG